MNRKHSIYTSQFIKIAICLITLLTLIGCGSKSMVVLLPDPNGDVGQVVVSTKKGEEKILSQANQSVQAQGESASIGKVRVLTKEQIKSKFSEALAAEPTPPELFIFYFRHNSDELTDESNALVPELIKAIQKRAAPDIVVSGHTDTVGEMDYNYKLSLERAEVMFKILVAQGIAPADIIVTSHGEGNLLVKTGDNVEEPKNRRVEVVIK